MDKEKRARKTPTVAIYTRVGNYSQLDKSIEQQSEECRKHAKANGFEPIEMLENQKK